MKNFVNFVLICFLSFFSRSVYSQQFISAYDANLYPALNSTNYIPPSNRNDLAVLRFTLDPAGDYNNIVDASIISSVSGAGLSSSVYGWSETHNIDGVNKAKHVYCIIDSSRLYMRSSSTAAGAAVLRQVQRILTSKNLGTVQERSVFIGFLRQDISPSPIILVHYIKPWVVIGFAIFLSLPMWWVIKRALR